MGLWGKFTSMFKGGPSQPAPRPYTEDRYWGPEGPGQERTFGADELAYNELQKMSERPYGFTPEELNAMYQPGAEAINLGTAAQLRRSSRGGAQSGAFGSGGRRRREGSILSKGAQAKAGGKWNLAALQAKTALQDRYKRIAALEGYALPRLGLQAGEHGRRLGYDMGLNTLDQRAFENAQRQYNQDMDWGWNELTGGPGSGYQNVMGNISQGMSMFGGG
jgi:hypothetical protein